MNLQGNIEPSLKLQVVIRLLDYNSIYSCSHTSFTVDNPILVAVCCLYYIYTNEDSTQLYTANTIPIVWNFQLGEDLGGDNLGGDSDGNLRRDSAGDICGDFTGDLHGDSDGDLRGDSDLSLHRNSVGDSDGDLHGDLEGDLHGDSEEDSNRDLDGDPLLYLFRWHLFSQQSSL